MKKQATALALCAALLLLSACGSSAGQPPQPASTPAQSTEPLESPPAQAADPTQLREVSVSELYSVDGVYTDEWGTECAYSYHVPQLEDDTPDCAYINSQIAAVYGEAIEGCHRSMDNGEAPEYVSMTYESCRSGDILSLIIKRITYFGYFGEYQVYNYSLADGSLLSSSDVLARLGINQEDFLRAVRQAAARHYDDTYLPLWEIYGFGDYPGDFEERRSWTLSNGNITYDLMLFPDALGTVNVILPIGAHADADRINTILPVSVKAEAPEPLTANLSSYLTATLQKGALSLRLTRDDEVEAVLLENGCTGEVPYGAELEVQGLYDDYTGVFCGVIGEMMQPYVFLLTDAGRVECVDVISGLRGGYFCASGPLIGVEDAVSFTAGTDKYGYETVYAVCGDGSPVDLAPYISALRNALSYRLLGSWSAYLPGDTAGAGGEVFCSLDLFSLSGVQLQRSVFETGEETCYEGYFLYQGMTGDGMVYYYYLWDNTGDALPCEGVVAISPEYLEEDGAYICTLVFTELSGTLFRSAPCGTTVLTETYG